MHYDEWIFPSDVKIRKRRLNDKRVNKIIVICFHSFYFKLCVSSFYKNILSLNDKKVVEPCNNPCHCADFHSLIDLDYH